jgi:hypothetical protein
MNDPCFRCSEAYWDLHKLVCPKALMCYWCPAVYTGPSHREVCPGRGSRGGRGGRGGRSGGGGRVQQQQPHYQHSQAPQLPAAFGSAATVPGQQALTTIPQGQTDTTTSMNNEQEALVDRFRQFLNNEQQLN